jgi:hypothetical protein
MINAIRQNGTLSIRQLRAIVGRKVADYIKAIEPVYIQPLAGYVAYREDGTYHFFSACMMERSNNQRRDDGTLRPDATDINPRIRRRLQILAA